jgi:hypothetical protein
VNVDERVSPLANCLCDTSAKRQLRDEDTVGNVNVQAITPGGKKTF